MPTGSTAPEVKEAKEEAKRNEAAIEGAEAPEVEASAVISSEERVLLSHKDEKKLTKEDKANLEADSAIVRLVSFNTTYAVRADSDEAAIEAVKRDPSQFPFSTPTVTVQSRAAVGPFDFLTGEEHEKRYKATSEGEVARRERMAKEAAEARKASEKAEG